MKKKIQKFLSFVLLAVILSASFFDSSSVYAKNKYLELADVSIIDQSTTIVTEDPIIIGNKIVSSITFNELNDYVTYQLSLKNIGSSQVKLASITDNNTSEFIDLDYHYDDDYISTGDTITATVTIAYVRQLINQNLSFDDLMVNVTYENENGETGEIILVPDTGFFTHPNGGLAINGVVPIVVFVALMVTGIVLIVIKKKHHFTKIGFALLVSATVLFSFV